MNQGTHYEVLGLTPNCTPQDIKRSYRQLALIWHPDKHSNKIEAQTTFASINEAYNVLSDANKRRIYDTYGQQGLDMENSTSNNRTNFFCQKGFNGTDKSAFDILRDIFEDNDDESAYKTNDIFDFSNTFKSTFESFMNDSFVSAEEDNSNFLNNYKPTFMSETFSSQFISLDQLYGNQKNSKKSTDANPLTKRNSPQGQKNNKRVFLINEEEEDQVNDTIFSDSMRGTRVDRKLSFYSQAFGESDNSKAKVNKSKKSGKRDSCNLEGLYQEKGYKKMKTLHIFIQKDEPIFKDDELIC